MHTKLILRIKESLIKTAKKYSKIHGLPPITRSLKGILRGKKINEDHYKKYIEGRYQ